MHCQKAFGGGHRSDGSCREFFSTVSRPQAFSTVSRPHAKAPENSRGPSALYLRVSGSYAGGATVARV
ncbi:hypothetical protein RHOER0001_4441 [Rhodococcus erythropolis SK121]|nr:hypothetical protein RHOER0001_4441 [Rhodococcus erythropolis SK121]